MSNADEHKPTDWDDWPDPIDDHADGRMDPGWARVQVAFIVVSLLALWGTVDLVLRAIAWWNA